MTVLNTADDLKLGDTQVDRVYLGSTLVWENEPSTGEGWSLDDWSLTDWSLTA